MDFYFDQAFNILNFSPGATFFKILSIANSFISFLATDKII